MPQVLAIMGAKALGGGANAYAASSVPSQQLPQQQPQQAATQPGQMGGQESPMAMLMKLLQQRQQNQIVPGSTRGYETGAANNMFGG